MSALLACSLPADSFLSRYQREGAYVDCYSVDLPGPVTQARFVEAFYTTPVFTLERAILALVVNRPSTEVQAAQLGQGRLDAFAAWRVEQQSNEQLLLCDLHGRTRSWLMALPMNGPAGASTRLYFGSAVVAAANPGQAKNRRGRGFGLLLGFHKVYSKVLLGAACSRLMAAAAGPPTPGRLRGPA